VKSPEEAEMQLDDVKGLVGQFWKTIGGGEPDSVDDLLDPGYRLHDLTNRRDHDPDETRELAATLRGTMPGLALVIEDQALTEDGRVVTRFTLRAPLRDEPGFSVESAGIDISRVGEGGVSESWVSWDTARLERELGPPPEGESDRTVRWWRWPPWR
jgi:hypothetical protein